jgi:hypothetical protein
MLAKPNVGTKSQKRYFVNNLPACCPSLLIAFGVLRMSSDTFGFPFFMPREMALSFDIKLSLDMKLSRDRPPLPDPSLSSSELRADLLAVPLEHSLPDPLLLAELVPTFAWVCTA